MARSEEKVRLAVIGCGRIAREGHLPYYRANPRVELAAAVDISEKNREQVCSKFGISSSYDSPEEMFSREKPDAVIICTPSWAHRELTLLAAENGAHVFCEKPMAANPGECEDMIRVCAEKNLKLQIGMVKRFDAGIVKAKKMIRAGRLGGVSQMAAYSMNPPAPMDTPLMETVKKWSERLGIDFEEKTGWWRFTDPRAVGGNLMEMGTHLLDLILYFADEKVSGYSGFINKKRADMIFEDQGTMMVKFPSGTIATVELNMSVTADTILDERVRVYGDKGSIDVHHFNGMWFGVPFYEYIPTRVVYFTAPSPFLGGGLPVPVGIGKKIYMHKLQADYFIDSIVGGDTDYFGFGPDFAATGEDGLEVMKVIDRAYNNK